MRILKLKKSNNNDLNKNSFLKHDQGLKILDKV